MMICKRKDNNRFKLYFSPYITIINKNTTSILKGYNLLPLHLLKIIIILYI